jgi:hypothetical protein
MGVGLYNILAHPERGILSFRRGRVGGWGLENRLLILGFEGFHELVDINKSPMKLVKILILRYLF